MNPHIVLFLDIDGVLLPFPTNPKLTIPNGRIFPNETLDALTLILEAFPNTSESVISSDSPIGTTVDIVLSSTWRVQKSMRDEIIADFHAYKHGPLSTYGDDFYDITDPMLHTERQHEIYEWIQQYNKNITNHRDRKNEVLIWVALDDEELVHGPTNAQRKSIFDGHVIHCDSKVGLTRSQAIEAIQLLQQQLNLATSR